MKQKRSDKNRSLKGIIKTTNHLADRVNFSLNNKDTLTKPNKDDDVIAKEYSTKDYVDSDEEVKGDSEIYVKRQKKGNAKKTSFKDKSLEITDEEEALNQYSTKLKEKLKKNESISSEASSKVRHESDESLTRTKKDLTKLKKQLETMNKNN